MIKPLLLLFKHAHRRATHAYTDAHICTQSLFRKKKGHGMPMFALLSLN